MDMEFHKGISSSGKLYGLGSFAALDEDIVKHIETSEELEIASVAKLDELSVAEELDSGIYRSI
ncbi:MAG: hypothetical protein SPL52_10095 [Fibrobacter sp.]|nr:hypothetical protein [Fibrobacter sp.]